VLEGRAGAVAMDALDRFNDYRPTADMRIALAGEPAPLLDGYIVDQPFYIAYGQSWRQKDRDGWLRARLLSNPHAPPLYRVDGCIRNDDGWYAAFPVAPTDKYYLRPQARVRLWQSGGHLARIRRIELVLAPAQLIARTPP
jgi:hypothetical protein